MQDQTRARRGLLASEPIESPAEDMSIFLFQAIRELLFNVITCGKAARVQVQV
jgi:nitrate/nitrite-specific signal transduction histidine kinase